jgi:serine/threonine protein phosphatase PrpC
MYQQNSSPETTHLRVSAAGYTDTRRLRAHNEDTIALCEPPDRAMLAQLGWLCLLADGVGDRAAGELASRTAIETISSIYYDLTVSCELGAKDLHIEDTVVRHLHGPLYDLEDPIKQIRRAFFAAHGHIREFASLKPEYTGIATTCIAAVIKGAQLLVAHVGDSRAYLIQTSPESLPTLTRLTTDHSIASELVRAGIIPPEQVQSSPSRHILLRALGGSKHESPSLDVTTCVVQAGDNLVLCSVGLWSMLSEEQITMVVSSNKPHMACSELIRLANEAGGEDDISTVVLSFHR